MKYCAHCWGVLVAVAGCGYYCPECPRIIKRHDKAGGKGMNEDHEIKKPTIAEREKMEP